MICEGLREALGVDKRGVEGFQLQRAINQVLTALGCLENTGIAMVYLRK